jgi:hypothetical protein
MIPPHARPIPGIVGSRVTELRSLIEDLGRDGGLITPSVYDTAQVLRFWPPREAEPALAWLITQQRPDGGWGEPATPLTRDLPTLAAVLALQAHADRIPVRDRVEAGVAFLRRSEPWPEPLPDDTPCGAELILPWMVGQAAAQGLSLPPERYRSLLALGQRRRQRIAWQPMGVGTPLTHSWEAWGGSADPAFLDGSGGIGHSPAATAAWLRAAARQAGQEEARRGAERYLQRAAAATRVGIPGVVPTAWPVDRFEQAFGLFALVIAGLLELPRLADVVQPQLLALAQSLRPGGLGASDFFAPDADHTAAAVAVLRSGRCPVDLSVLRPFERDGHFCTWPGELPPSLSVNARVAFARLLCGADTPHVQKLLTQRQTPDGRWSGDRWNRSWLHTTLIVLLSRGEASVERSREAAVKAVLADQRRDGAWGCGDRASALETAYGVLALHWIQCQGSESREVASACRRGQRWLLHHPSASEGPALPRLAKEPYGVPRVNRAFRLSALLAGTLDEGRGDRLGAKTDAAARRPAAGSE